MEKNRSKRKEYQNSKRKVVLSVLALVVCVAMLLGTTLAWFTDSVTSGRNKIVAGDLDIAVTHQSGKMKAAEPVNIDTKLFTDVALWEPGAVEYENINIKNVGNLVLKAKLQITDVAKNAMKAEYGGYDLTTAIKVAMKEGGFAGELTRETITGDTSLTWSTFSTFEETIARLDPNESKTYGIALYWEPTDHDNDWNLNNGKESTDGQPLWIEFGLNVVATQKDAEVDSFDDTYDKNATYPILASVVNKTDIYSGNFAQNKIQSGSGDSTQVTALQDIKLANDTSVTLIQAGTTLFKSDGTNDVPIVTSNDNAQGYPGSIIANIKTKESVSNSVTYQIGYKYVEGTTETVVSKFSNIVTNVFDISKGLKHVKVTTNHNGGSQELTALSENVAADNSFFYDKANGKLYIYSTCYSDFKVTYEYDFYAAVDGQGYLTLAEAVEKAPTNSTVTLLKNVSENVIIPAGKTLTLDLGGKTINGGTVAEKPAIKNNGTLTLKGNGTVKREDTGANAYYVIQNCGTMTIEKVTVTNGSGYNGAGASLIINDCKAAGGKLTINNLKFEQQNFIVVKNDNGNLEINGGTFLARGAYEKQPVYGLTSAIQNWDQCTINGGTFSGGISDLSYGDAATMTIKGGTFNNATIWLNNYLSNSNVPNLYIEGGTFNFNEDHAFAFGSTKSTTMTAKENLSITGGTYSKDPSAFVASGYKATANGTDPETWTVAESTDVYYITEMSDATDWSEPSEYYTITKTASTTLTRKVYAPGISDIMEYLGLGSGDTVTSEDLNKMFFGEGVLIEGANIWLRSACSLDHCAADVDYNVWFIYSDGGTISTTYPSDEGYEALRYRAVFVADLDDVSYTGTFAKGEIITIDSKEYRVLSKDGTKAKLLTMYDAGTEGAFNHLEDPFEDEENNVYKDSTMDQYLTGDFWNTLSADLKAAIVETDITVNSYEYDGPIEE